MLENDLHSKSHEIQTLGECLHKTTEKRENEKKIFEKRMDENGRTICELQKMLEEEKILNCSLEKKQKKIDGKINELLSEKVKAESSFAGDLHNKDEELRNKTKVIDSFKSVAESYGFEVTITENHEVIFNRSSSCSVM
jgi:Skp family chaperone for outer membrane proteins